MQRAKRYITVTCVITKEDDQFSVVCTELDTASYGDSVEEALDNITEAIEVDLTALAERGQLRSFLRERGVKIMQGPPKRQVSARRPVRPDEFVTRKLIPVPAA